MTRDIANVLNDYAVNVRYPGSYDDFSIDEIKETVNVAKDVIEISKELTIK